MRSKKYVMYIDETGTSGGPHPFTVTGVIFPFSYSVNQEGGKSELTDLLERFKKFCFNQSDIHLHLKQISKAESPFSFKDGITKTQLQKFWLNLPGFLNNLDFHIISVTVDKAKLNQYYITPKDPYVVAFAHIMESFYSFIVHHDAESARIVLESRDDNQNLLIQKAFFDIYNSGTLHMNVESTKEKIKGFIFAGKKDPMYQSGLEITDLVCNPLSRVRLGKKEVNPQFIKYGKENKIFESIQEKIYTSSSADDFRNWGFKKVPITKKKREWLSEMKV